MVRNYNNLHIVLNNTILFSAKLTVSMIRLHLV